VGVRRTQRRPKKESTTARWRGVNAGGKLVVGRSTPAGTPKAARGTATNRRTAATMALHVIARLPVTYRCVDMLISLNERAPVQRPTVRSWHQRLEPAVKPSFIQLSSAPACGDHAATTAR